MFDKYVSRAIQISIRLKRAKIVVVSSFFVRHILDQGFPIKAFYKAFIHTNCVINQYSHRSLRRPYD